MSEHKEPIPSMIYNASIGGHVTNSQQIIDENENKEQSQINAEIKQTLGQGGSVDSRINKAKTDIIGGASSNGNTLKKIESRVSPIESAIGSGGSVDSRIATAKSEIKGNASSDCDTLGKAEIKINANTIDISAESSRAKAAEEQLRVIYNTLQQSQPVPVTELPAIGEAGKIYRLAGVTSYADYMYAEDALTIPIKMAEYNNAIDNKPIAESENLVKSGGILAWGEENYGKYVDNSNYIDIKEDSEGKLLEGTRTDGTKELGGNLIIYGTINGENIQDKVNKEKGKGLSTNDFNNNEKEIVDMNFLSEKNDIQQIVDAEDKILGGFDKHGNPLYNENKNFKNCLSRKKYLGVTVWDGGSPSAHPDIKEVDTISNEQYANSSIYDPNYPNWRDYVKHVYGKYPPKMCSFATFFNTNTDIEPSRKPIDTLYSETVGGNVDIGWWYSGYIEKTEDTNPGTLHETEKVEAQIDLASDYDIDYFAICFYCNQSCFNNDGSINELLLKNIDENNFIYQYMASRNKWKIRFCLILFISSLNKQQTYTFMKYVDDNFLSDPQYLYVNGAPIVLCYNINFTLQNYNFVRFKGCNMIVNSVYNKLDGAFKYSFSASSKNMKFKAFSMSNLNSWNVLSNKENYFFAFPISTGIDDRGRYGYTTEKALSRNYAEKPTEIELYNALIDVISLANKRCQSDIMIIIYAWSEFIEGGWILPTQADIDNGNGTFRLEAIKKAKNFLSNNY